MANFFEIVPQVVVLGTATNGFNLTFYYDPVDHSIVKLLINNRNGTLANDTLVSFNRKGLATVQTTSIPTADTLGQTGIATQLGSGDVCDSVVPHSAGFGV